MITIVSNLMKFMKLVESDQLIKVSGDPLRQVIFHARFGNLNASDTMLTLFRSKMGKWVRLESGAR